MHDLRKNSGRNREIKWLATVFLLICAGLLLHWKPKPRPAKIELLPIAESHPSWDGSYPFLTISLSKSDNGHQLFSSSISLIQPTIHHDGPINEFQVDLHSGKFILRQTDFFVPDTQPLALIRTYALWDQHSRAFGKGGNHPYDICPTGTRFPYTYQDLNLEDGRQLHFPRASKGTGYADAAFRHNETSSEFYGAMDSWNGDGWTMKLKDGTTYKFPEAYYAKNFAQGAAWEIWDAHGHLTQLKRDAKRNLQQLISPSGHAITFKYDSEDRIIEASDDAGNVRKYEYDVTGHLQTVSDAQRILYHFEYADLLHDPDNDDPYLMTRVIDGNGRILLENSYDNGRVSKQRLLDGQVFQYRFYFANNELVQTFVTDSTGTHRFFFNHGILYREW